MDTERTLIPIVIVDGHDLYRLGLARYLEREPDLHVVAHASNGPAGLRLIRQLQPGVVVLDQDLPDIAIADVVTGAPGGHAAPRVVVLNSSMTATAVTDAVSEGASSYLGKDSDVDDIVAAIRAAAAGNSWLSGEASGIVFSQLRLAPPAGLPQGAATRLSTRELDVLKLLARGFDNAEIADALAITPSTAKNHVSNILTKLEVPSRILAAIYAIRQNIV